MNVQSVRPRHDKGILIPSGEFTMGSEQFYPEERPLRRVKVREFRIDRHPVTYRQFARFVENTGYQTFAELPPDPSLYPDADPSFLVPGSLVFTPPSSPVSLLDFRAWWAYVPGANWRYPWGKAAGKQPDPDHPVVQVTFADALAYAKWVGGTLPDEAEWEYAARGGLEGKTYSWGDEFMPAGRHMANTWQGRFPWENLAEDGFTGTSPVMSYPANGYGLFDMTGNVWEWTSSRFTPNHASSSPHNCCTPERVVNITGQRNVVKGGSHLCAPNYCLRYRPAARQGQTLDTATSHIGFRCITRVGS
ncbi:formylglycine-generating enzyme family protein [Tatumella sp. UBA2305]|uniref:formylglycine-generating enzyme family protein n=1 Tax=Tatumella sp. UBA2305 TaxID=1947647 RepID=UPI0025E29223|nr:formylglycine-generating enzyme family protein [Tatumella sp. UBA2305]